MSGAIKAGVILGLLLLTSVNAWAQRRARIDLDDMMIKGQLLNDDRLMIMAREKNQLKNYVKFRTSYKEEMLRELPVPKPKYRY